MDEMKTIQGIDASRRVGWAKYYASQDEVDELRLLLWALGDAVILHSRIHSDDPILDLARRAQAA